MTIRKVARLGHPVLRKLAAAVPPDEVRSAEVQGLIADMLDTVREYDGAGLAAPQVYESTRIVVLQLGDEADGEYTVWVNPVVAPIGEEQVVSYEGCLSIPDLRAAVARPAKVDVRALDARGKAVHRELEGFPAIVAQHECDHLDGVLFVDRADPRTMTFLAEYRRFGAWPLERRRENQRGESAGAEPEGEEADEPA